MSAELQTFPVSIFTARNSLTNNGELNFVDSRCTEEQIRELFFDDDIIYLIDKDTSIEQLFSEYLMVFPSKSQARKNGKSGPIAKGWQRLFLKSKSLAVYIWMPDDLWFNYDEWLKQDKEKYPEDYDKSGNPIPYNTK